MFRSFIHPEFCSCQRVPSFLQLFWYLEGSSFKTCCWGLCWESTRCFSLPSPGHLFFLPRDGGCLGVFKFCFFSLHWFPIDFINMNPLGVHTFETSLLRGSTRKTERHACNQHFFSFACINKSTWFGYFVFSGNNKLFLPRQIICSHKYLSLEKMCLYNWLINLSTINCQLNHQKMATHQK